MQQNIIPAPTSKLSFKVQFFAETYFCVIKSFARIAKIRFLQKFLVIRYSIHMYIYSFYFREENPLQKASKPTDGDKKTEESESKKSEKKKSSRWEDAEKPKAETSKPPVSGQKRKSALDEIMHVGVVWYFVVNITFSHISAIQ